MTEKSKQRIDADNAFLRMQTKSAVRDRILTESETIARARDEKTARLKAQRLEKEALDRDGAAPTSLKPA